MYVHLNAYTVTQIQMYLCICMYG